MASGKWGECGEWGEWGECGECGKCVEWGECGKCVEWGEWGKWGECGRGRAQHRRPPPAFAGGQERERQVAGGALGSAPIGRRVWRGGVGEGVGGILLEDGHGKELRSGWL